ncbi:M23 family metallopeptidase [Bacteroides fragilis]|nr:M23 family metallopeptidase [Bacteroides fragilis]
MAVGLAAPVYATASGTVSFAGRKGGYGRCVIIRHSYGFETLYAHWPRITPPKVKKSTEGL